MKTASLWVVVITSQNRGFNNNIKPYTTKLIVVTTPQNRSFDNGSPDIKAFK